VHGPGWDEGAINRVLLQLMLLSDQVHFEFVLVPLTFAYFFTFLVAPVPPPSHKYHDRRSGLTEICYVLMQNNMEEQVLNFLEFRPLVIGSSHPHEKGIVCCIDTEPDPDYAGERRYSFHLGTTPYKWPLRDTLLSQLQKSLSSFVDIGPRAERCSDIQWSLARGVLRLLYNVQATSFVVGGCGAATYISTKDCTMGK
jgi:hypothetical protein